MIDLYVTMPCVQIPEGSKPPRWYLCMFERYTHSGRWYCAGAMNVTIPVTQLERERLYYRFGRNANCQRKFATVEVERHNARSVTASLYTKKWEHDWQRLRLDSFFNQLDAAMLDCVSYRGGKQVVRRERRGRRASSE